MKKPKMAACGIDCTQCASYKATTEQDLNAAESLVGWYKGNGWIGEGEGAQAVLDKNPICYGCWDITEDCFWKCGCGSVDFRICCTERQIDHCGQCVDFPCEHYKIWAGWHESHQKAMEYLYTLK